MKQKITKLDFDKVKINPISLNFNKDGKKLANSHRNISNTTAIIRPTLPLNSNSNRKSLVCNEKMNKNLSMMENVKKSNTLDSTSLTNIYPPMVIKVSTVENLNNTISTANTKLRAPLGFSREKGKDDFGLSDLKNSKLSLENESILNYSNSFRRLSRGNTVYERDKERTPTSTSQNRATNIKVVVRFRPLNEIEEDLLKNGVGYVYPTYPFPPVAGNGNTDTIDDNCNSICLKNLNFKNEASYSLYNDNSSYNFDRVFRINSAQEEIYDFIGLETIRDVLSGYNGTIFTYGQSGSGKTFTMYGNDIYDEDQKGLIPRIISQIFDSIDKSDGVIFQVKLSVLQIYKEIIYDLLTGEKDLKIKENPSKGIYVEGLSEVFVDSPESFLNYVELAQQLRMVSETKLNKISSRSHSILILEITQTNSKGDNLMKKGVLNLVDLAGSEKVSKTGAIGEILEEAKKINLSLSALGNVIHALTIENKNPHIPYRDSKLTRLLQESLGGNFKTSIIVNCSPHSYHIEETTSSLKFAQRAKTIKNKVKMNIKLGYDELQKMVTTLQHETTGTGEKQRIFTKSSDDCLYCKEKIEMLNYQIREKDESIFNLEEEIKKLKVIKEQDTEKDTEKVEDLEKFILLYKEIKISIDNIQNERKDNFTKVNEMFELSLKQISELYYQTIEYLNNKYTLENLTQSFNNYSPKFDSNYDFLNEIPEHYKFISSLSSITPNPNNELISKLLLKFINYSFTLESFNKMNNYMNIQNDLLQNENNILINLVEDLLKSNHELSQNLININKNMVNSMYKNFKRTFLGSNNNLFTKETFINNLNSSNSLKYVNNQDCCSIKNEIINLDKSKIIKKYSMKVETFISKKNIDIKKKMKLLDSSILESDINKDCSNFDNNIFMINKTSGKELSRLSKLQDFIVNSIKESENIKTNFKKLRDDFISISYSKIDKKWNPKYHREIQEDRVVTDNNDLISPIYKKIDLFKLHPISNKSHLEKKCVDINHLDSIINSYIESGTATRKFDGIACKTEDNKIKWYFSSGLTCENSITNKPLTSKEHLMNKEPDTSVQIEDSIIFY